MKAAYIRECGPPQNIQYGDLPDPTPSGDQVLVRVKAVAVNPIDTYIRAGGVKMNIPTRTSSVAMWRGSSSKRRPARAFESVIASGGATRVCSVDKAASANLPRSMPRGCIPHRRRSAMKRQPPVRSWVSPRISGSFVVRRSGG